MKKTIGFVTTSFPRTAGDFAGNFVYHMAESLAALGYHIDVVVPEPPPNQPTSWRTQNAWPPWITIHPVSYSVYKKWQCVFFSSGAPENLHRTPISWALTPFAIWQMWKTIERLTPSWCAVVSHWLVPSALIAPRVAGPSIPHLAIAHSADVHLLGKLPGKSILSSLIARRSKIVGFVSSQLLQEFRSFLPSNHDTSNFRCTPMGIPKLSSQPSRTDARKILNLRRFTILFLGRLVPIKGIDTLIAAAQIENVDVLIAGEGEQREHLERLCKKKNVQATFVGQVNPQKRCLLLRAADALVLPSRQLPDGRHEGVPMVISEAMQAGLPVIATKTGGIGELIIHRYNGLLVEPNCPRQLAKAIHELKQNEPIIRTLCFNGKETARAKQWDFLIPNYHNLLFN